MEKKKYSTAYEKFEAEMSDKALRNKRPEDMDEIERAYLDAEIQRHARKLRDKYSNEPAFLDTLTIELAKDALRRRASRESELQ
jgi:hypothetical protein